MACLHKAEVIIASSRWLKLNRNVYMIILEVNPRNINAIKLYKKIGYLAPFPDMWTAQGVNPGSGIMRKISGIEMLIAYVAFMAGFVGLIIKRKSEYIVIIMAVLLASAVIVVV